MYEFVLTIARKRVERIGLAATAAAAKVDKSQLSRWLSTAGKRRDLRAEAFARMADSLGVDTSWGGWPEDCLAPDRAKR